MSLQKEKSPGPDGIPVEFYQNFWGLIKDMYFDFIQEVKIAAFPNEKNISITRLIYKEKGEIYLLANYRPIALMNVDVKILTKILATRLKYVLPTIIHQSQNRQYNTLSKRSYTTGKRKQRRSRFFVHRSRKSFRSSKPQFLI